MSKAKPKVIHEGIHFSRVTSGHNPREKAFAQHWKKECQKRPGLDYGLGLLQDLMIIEAQKGGPGFKRSFLTGSFLKLEYEIEPRDARIVATVIQWLGSNCGMYFLAEVLKDVGYSIVKKDETP